jgi:hypothetical protein
MSSYGKRCKPPTVFPACGPRCEAVVPRFHDCLYSSLWFLLFLFRAVLLLEKKNQIPSIVGSLRTGARAVKGGGVCRSLEKSGNP